jgi:hypothetical protein
MGESSWYKEISIRVLAKDSNMKHAHVNDRLIAELTNWRVKNKKQKSGVSGQAKKMQPLLHAALLWTFQFWDLCESCLLVGLLDPGGCTLSIDGRRAVDRLQMQEEACPICGTEGGAKDGGQRAVVAVLHCGGLAEP